MYLNANGAGGKSNIIESYQYDESGNLQKKTVSEFENGNIKISTVYDSDNQKIRYSLSTYNVNNKISKIESYDKTDKLEEYYTYDYNDANQTVKYSVYDANGNIKKYTTFEYNEDGALSVEKFYNNADVLEQYYVFTYYESGQMKSSSYYDGNGNQTTQTEQVQTAITKGAKAIIVNIVNTGSDDAAQNIVNLAREKGIPVVFFNRSVNEEVIKSYDKCIMVGTDYEMAGHMQGELIGNYVFINSL